MEKIKRIWKNILANPMRFFSILCLIAAAICLGIFVYQQKNNEKQEEKYEKVRQESKVEEESSEETHDFAALKETNEDIYGWINVPNTIVDYPVLQSEEDNYYLNHDLDHTETIAGAIYSNACNSQDMSDGITILYGHDMKADTMFGSLHLFDEADFFETNETMTFETADAIYTYQIFGVYNFNDSYLPSLYDVTSASGVESFLSDLESCANERSSITHVREDVEVTSSDKLLVLSTCISGRDDRRFLVVGKLVDVTEHSSDSME